MFRNKKYVAWNFHLFSNLVSVCCETFRNVANFGLSHFWVCFNLFQLIFGSNLVSVCCETFQISDLVIFGLFQFVSVDLLL